MKPYFAEGSEAMIELEAMVDKAGLRNVMWALQHIDELGCDRISEPTTGTPTSGRL